mmetsp:Transcript_23239/g.22810  ORF Transcript_23239/g.22810 Transcript_23239/m.22810 type:complete len:305 (+) Transcript_23239:855-1769(+)
MLGRVPGLAELVFFQKLIVPVNSNVRPEAQELEHGLIVRKDHTPQAVLRPVAHTTHLSLVHDQLEDEGRVGDLGGEVVALVHPFQSPPEVALLVLVELARQLQHELHLHPDLFVELSACHVLMEHDEEWLVEEADLKFLQDVVLPEQQPPIIQSHQLPVIESIHVMLELLHLLEFLELLLLFFPILGLFLLLLLIFQVELLEVWLHVLVVLVVLLPGLQLQVGPRVLVHHEERGAPVQLLDLFLPLRRDHLLPNNKVVLSEAELEDDLADLDVVPQVVADLPPLGLLLRVQHQLHHPQTFRKDV